METKPTEKPQTNIITKKDEETEKDDGPEDEITKSIAKHFRGMMNMQKFLNKQKSDNEEESLGLK